MANVIEWTRRQMLAYKGWKDFDLLKTYGVVSLFVPKIAQISHLLDPEYLLPKIALASLQIRTLRFVVYISQRTGSSTKEELEIQEKAKKSAAYQRGRTWQWRDWSLHNESEKLIQFSYQDSWLPVRRRAQVSNVDAAADSKY